MSTYTEEVRKRLQSKVKLAAIGNSKRKMRDVAVDLINASDMGWKDIAAGCYLSKATIAKLAKDETRNPQSETLERIFRFFNFRMDLVDVPIKGQFQNEPKGKRRKK